MKEKSRFVVVFLLVGISGCLWLLTLKNFASYTILHPLVTNLFGVFILAVGGGIAVSLLPGFLWGMLSDEDEITGEQE